MKSNLKLKDLTLKIGSGATPRGGKDSYLKEGEISLIRSQNVYNHSFTTSGLVFISEEQAHKLKNVTLQENDILLNITGDSVARCCIVPKNLLPARVNQHVAIIRCDSEKLDVNYLLAVLTSPKMQQYLLSIAQTGGTRAALTKGMIENLDIPYISIYNQKFIGNILNLINSKIEINQSIISDLEQLAQTLFRRWFIDFEFPNENGEPYQSSGGKMFEHELGLIPDGWEVTSLDRIADYQNGLAMQKFRPDIEGDSLPVLKIKELNQGTTDKNSDRCRIDIKESVRVYDGDIIFSWSGTLLVKVWVGGKAGLNQHLFKVTSKDFPKWLYYFWTKHHLNRFINIAADKATTMGHINRTHLSESKVVIPPTETLLYLNKIIQPIFNTIIEKGCEIKTLERLRDSLLPKLLSGEIEIPLESEEKIHVQI